MNHWTNPNLDNNDHIQMTPWKWTVIRADNLILGKGTDIGAHTVRLCQQGIEIQDKAQIGPNCSILSISTIDGKQGKVTIKRNARVGANSVIMPGVTVGENSIVGAGSVLTTNVPDDQVWYGSPAKFRREIS